MKLRPLLSLSVALLTACTATLPAQSPTPAPALPKLLPTPLRPEERAFALKYFTETREDLVRAVKGLTEAQLKFKAAPDRWSILECLEHIALSEPVIWSLMQKSLGEPVESEKVASVKMTDQELIAKVTDRSGKVQAPEMLKPSGKFANAAAALAAFVEQRNQEIKFLETTAAPLRFHVGQHPVLGPMNALQLALLNAAHGKRHTLQIEEVKADKGFPKS